MAKSKKNLSTLTAAIKPRAELILIELCRGKAVKKISNFNSQLSTFYYLCPHYDE